MREVCAEVNDEELIARIRQGDGRAAELLCRKYLQEAEIKAGAYYLPGGERDDLVQEGMVGLFKAIRDYDPGKEASFATFANLCISRQILTAMSSSRSKKHAPLNGALSLSQKVTPPWESAGDGTELAEFLVARGADPEEQVVSRENLEGLESEIDTALSPLEKTVLSLLLSGKDYVEIAKALGRSNKSIDNAIQRLRGKIRKIVA